MQGTSTATHDQTLRTIFPTPDSELEPQTRAHSKRPRTPCTLTLAQVLTTAGLQNSEYRNRSSSNACHRCDISWDRPRLRKRGRRKYVLSRADRLRILLRGFTEGIRAEQNKSHCKRSYSFRFPRFHVLSSKFDFGQVSTATHLFFGLRQSAVLPFRGYCRYSR